MKEIPEKIKIWLAFFALGFVSWGTAYLAIKIALTELTPWGIVFYRYLIATLLLWPIVIVRHKNRVPLKTWKRMMILGIINSVIPIFLIVWGEQYVSSGLAGLIMGSIPLFTAILSIAILKEKLKFIQYGGIALGFFGMMILSWPNIQGSWSCAGLIALVIAAIFYAISGVYVKLKLDNIDLLLCGATACATSCVLAGISGLIFDNQFLNLPHNLKGWGVIGWLGVICTAMDYLLFVYLIQKIGATKTSTVDYIVPVAAVALGVILLHEKIDLYAILGGTLMLIGVFITNHSSIFKKKEEVLSKN